MTQKQKPTEPTDKEEPMMEIDKEFEERIWKIFVRLGYNEDKAKLGTHLVEHSTCCRAPVKKFQRTKTRTEYTCQNCGLVRGTIGTHPVVCSTMPLYLSIALPNNGGFLVTKEPASMGKKRQDASKWVFKYCYNRDPKEAGWMDHPYKKECDLEAVCASKWAVCDVCYDEKAAAAVQWPKEYLPCAPDCKRHKFHKLLEEGIIPGEQSKNFAERMGCMKHDECPFHYKSSKDYDSGEGEKARWTRCPNGVALRSTGRKGRRPNVNSPLFEKGTRIIEEHHAFEDGKLLHDNFIEEFGELRNMRDFEKLEANSYWMRAVENGNKEEAAKWLKRIRELEGE